MFTSLYCKHCKYCIISTIQDMVRDIVRLRTARQNRILRLSFPLFRNSTSKSGQRKVFAMSRLASISKYYYRSYGKCYRIARRLIFNTQATTQKRTENRCHFGRVIFLCSLERFISKSLQDRKKLQTNYSYLYGVQ